MAGLYTADPIKGFVKCGDLEPSTLVFTKTVERSKHYFNLIKGYGIQKDVYDKLKRYSCKKIIIKETDTGVVLSSSIEDWENFKAIWTGQNGKQVVLSEKYMTLIDGV